MFINKKTTLFKKVCLFYTKFTIFQWFLNISLLNKLSFLSKIKHPVLHIKWRVNCKCTRRTPTWNDQVVNEWKPTLLSCLNQWWICVYNQAGSTLLHRQYYNIYTRYHAIAEVLWWMAAVWLIKLVPAGDLGIHLRYQPPLLSHSFIYSNSNSPADWWWAGRCGIVCCVVRWHLHRVLSKRGSQPAEGSVINKFACSVWRGCGNQSEPSAVVVWKCAQLDAFYRRFLNFKQKS